MNKNIKLLYCILGSIILSLTSTSVPYNALRNIPIVGFYLSQITYLVAGIGVLLTLYFTVLLIKENWKFKNE